MNYAVIAASIKKTIIDRKTKSIIAALLLAASSTFAQVPSYVPSNGLVGWWPFNGNANDESGNGNNGTVNGASLTSDRSGNGNNAYSYDGVNDFIEVQNNSSLNPTNYTVSAWVNPSGFYLNNQDDANYIVGKGNDYNQGNYSLLYKSLNRKAYGAIGVFNFVNTTSSINTGNWYNLISTWDGTNLKIYFNGILENTSVSNSINIGNSNENLFFGTMATNPTWPYWLNGKIDDIGIWNRALTQQEITALYNSQSCTGTGAITADGPTTFCAGNFVNLTSNVTGATYQWKRNGINITTNGTSKTFKATGTGSYTCVASCTGTALTSNAIAVTSKTNASASVTASGATSFCAGDSVTLNCTNLGSNYSVQWYRTNVSMENATAYSQVVKQPGTYKVVTKNLTNGCSRISGSSAIVAVNCRLANPDVITNDLISTDLDAKVAGEDAKGKIYIYPNPTSDNKFTVELMGLELDGNATLEVYNGMGQILFSEKVNITNGTLNRTIQIDEQSKGQLCIVRLIIGSEVYDSKVILK